MKSTVETLSPTRVKLSVEVPFDELKPSLDKAYRSIAEQVTIPGFRRGKVPPRLIDQRVGRSTVISEAVNEAIPQHYSAAIREHEVVAMGQPDVEVTKLADGDLLTFTAEVDVRPEITLPEYKSIQVTVDELVVSDEDVTAGLSQLRDRFAVLKGVERAAQQGDFTSLDLEATIDGEEVEGGSTSGLSYEIGTNQLLDGLDDAIIGLSAGESTTFTSKLVGGERAGEEAEISVTVNSVKEKELPELDDEFAQTSSEFDTIDELTADTREHVTQNKRIEQVVQARDKVLKELVSAVEVPLPETVVASEVEYRKQSITSRLEAVGSTLEQYLTAENQTEEELDAELRESSEEAVRNQLVLDKVADAEELGVSNEELTGEVVQRAQQSGRQPQEYADELVNSGQLPLLVADVRRGKALALVLESAAITDSTGAKVDLAALEKASEEHEHGHGHGHVEDGDADADTKESEADSTEATTATDQS